MGCRVARAQAWALRCVHESTLHARNCFITLTYSPQQLPADGSLKVEDTQFFWKRLRKRLGSSTPIRFFLCGEYGPQTFRPHYHALVFGYDFYKDRITLKKRSEQALYTSKLLADTWQKGFVSIGPLDYKTAAYTARYCMKKINGDLAVSHYSRTDPITGETWQVRPEFMTCSKGIGKQWFEKWKEDVFPDDFIIQEGKKRPVPKYYLDQLPEEDQLTIKAKRLVKLRAAEITGSQLEAKEKQAQFHSGRLRRNDF